MSADGITLSSPWAVAIVVVVFDEAHGQQIQSVYPPNATRDATSKRGFSQRSIVLVCKHPFSSLAFKILRRMCAVVDNLPQKSVTQSENTSSSVSQEQYDRNMTVVVEVSFEHFLAWPHPKAGAQLELPFYGDIFNFTVPALMTYVDSGVEQEDDKSMPSEIMADGVEAESKIEGELPPPAFVSPPLGVLPELAGMISSTSSSARQMDGLGGGAGLFADENLVALLRPLGLLPHLWTLWELVVTGKDILVWAPSPELVSRVVTALVSLSAPLAYGGDFRPYITPYDSDISLLVAASAKNRERAECRAATAAAGSSVLGAVSLMGCSVDVASPPSSYGSEGNPSIFDAFESFYDMTTAGSAGGGAGRVGTLDTVIPSDGMDDLRDVTVEYVSSAQIQTRTTGADSRQSPSSSPSFFASVSGGAVSGKCRSGSSLGNCVTDTYANGQKSPSMIVGITNPFLLKSFSHFDSCIFLPIYDIPQDDTTPIKELSVRHGANDCVSPFSAARSQRRSLYSSRSTSKEVLASSIESQDAITLNIGDRGGGRMPFLSKSIVTATESPTPAAAVRTLPKSTRSPSPAPTAPVEPSFPCNVNRISLATSLEPVFDKWITSGGAGTTLQGSKNTMLVLRHPVSVKPDSRILQLVNSVLVEDNLTSQQQSLIGLFTSGSVRSTPGPNGAVGEKERRDIQANMLIREHFRQLTCWLMKPFAGHFQARSDLERTLSTSSTSTTWSPPPSTPTSFSSSGVGAADSKPDAAAGTAHDDLSVSIPHTSMNHRKSHLSLQIAAQQQSPHRRRGASSLWLYRNPTELLGGDSVGSSIRKYRKSGKHIPDCFLGPRRQELFTAFAESDTFQNYYRWRKRILTAQMLMEMALACCSLTGEELIEQFAIEKGSDVITQVQMKELEARINMYIRALSNVQAIPVQTSWLIDKMRDHLVTISRMW